jgi:protease-4
MVKEFPDEKQRAAVCSSSWRSAKGGKKSRSLARIQAALYCEPWLIRPEVHVKISEIVAKHVSGDAHAAGGIASLFQDEEDDRDMCEVLNEESRVWCIHIDGILGKRVGQLEKSSGVTDVDEISENFATLVNDPNVTGIVLDISSPGGTVTGTPELADEIYAARSAKPIIAYTDTMCASAAYWLAAQAHVIIASPSAVVGSVGVYLALLDASRAYEMAGLTMEVIKAGKYKGAGIQGTKLTDAQRELLQARVDALHARFKESVMRGHPNIKPEHMQGQDMYAEEARGCGMVDIVNGNIRSAADVVQTIRRS